MSDRANEVRADMEIWLRDKDPAVTMSSTVQEGGLALPLRELTPQPTSGGRHPPIRRRKWTAIAVGRQLREQEIPQRPSGSHGRINARVRSSPTR